MGKLTRLPQVKAGGKAISLRSMSIRFMEKKQIKRCDECQVSKEELEEFDSRKWCPDCLKEKTGICENCNSRFYKESLTTFDNSLWCDECLHEQTTICADCGERFYCDDARYVGDDPICESCYDAHYFQCDGCERCYHNDDYGEDGYCRNCLEEQKPSICPDNNRYYSKSRRDLSVGVEIEAEEGDYQSVYYDLADKGFGVCSDGSLASGGIEIQVPASNERKTEKLVRKACQSLQENGFKISTKCGLHVHIEYKSRLKTIKNLLLMVYACEPVFYALNPKSRQDNNYCQPIHKAFSAAEIIRTEAKEIDKLFYSKKHSGLTKSKVEYFKRFKWNECRYFGFNLHALFYQKTVEFRYHAGTIEPKKIINWINLLKAILLYVRFNYEQEKVLYLIEQPTILGKIKYLKHLLKLSEPLTAYIINRYLKFSLSRLSG
jgi:hypothetical protein